MTDVKSKQKSDLTLIGIFAISFYLLSNPTLIKGALNDLRNNA